MPPESETELSAIRVVPPSSGVCGEISHSESSLPRGRRFGDRDFLSPPAISSLPGAMDHLNYRVRMQPPLRRHPEERPIQTIQTCHKISTETRNGLRGTIVRDVIEYDPGFGVMGSLGQRLFIAPTLKQTSTARAHWKNCWPKDQLVAGDSPSRPPIESAPQTLPCRKPTLR
jgi:hypothetical protein